MNKFLIEFNANFNNKLLTVKFKVKKINKIWFLIIISLKIYYKIKKL